MNIRLPAAIYAMLIAILLGVSALIVSEIASLDDKPNCPTEDSCSVVWQNGEYRIVEIVP